MFSFSLKPWVLGVLCTLFFFKSVHAQSPFNSASYDLLSVVTPTGRLADRSELGNWISHSNANPLYHRGMGDSLCSPQTFGHILDFLKEMSFDPLTVQLHRDSISSYYDLSSFGYPSSQLNPSSVLNLGKTHDVVMGFIDVAYNSITRTAWDSGYVYFNAQDSIIQFLHENSSLNLSVSTDSLNPYSTTNTYSFGVNPGGSDSERIAQSFREDAYVALASFDPVVYLTSISNPVKIQLPGSLFWTSQPERIYEINLDDGNGFIPLQVGLTINAYYAFPGTKDIQVRSVNAFGEPGIIAKTQFRVVEIPEATDFQPIPFGGGTNWCSALSQESPGIGVATHFNGRGDTEMRKPFLIVEGFDRGAVTEATPFVSPVHEVISPYGFGNFHVASFVSGEYVDNTDHLGLSRVFVDSLLQRGYDVVFVDFYTNGATVQQNAKALIDLIGKIQNRLDQSGSQEEIQGIGVSMGGLVLRVALREIEMTGCCHRFSMYGSLSSPHKGAHIPLSLQFFIDGASNGGIDLPESFRKTPTDIRINVMECPVAKQMLIQQINPTHQAANHLFQQYLDSIGLPQQTFNIGMTNGNILGHSLAFNSHSVQPGDTLFELGARVSIPEEVPIPGQSTLSYLGDLLSGFQVFPTHNFPILEAFGIAVNGSFSGTNAQTLLSSYGDRTLAYPSAIAIAGYAGVGQLSYSIAPPPFNSVLGLVHSSILNGMHQLYNQSYNLTYNAMQVSTPTFGLDYCPGDLGSIDRLEKMTDGLVVSKVPNHTFVPSVSALNLNGGLFSDLSTILTGPSPGGFHSHWFPGISSENYSYNQVHAQINDSLIFWIMDALDVLESDPTGTDSLFQGVLAGHYNFAQSENSFAISPNSIRSLDILNGGHMTINEVGPINNGSIYHSALGSHHTLYTSKKSCDSVILRVHNGGLIEIGDTLGPNTGDLKLRPSSRLEILPGGGVRVFANSRLVVEPHATLIIHPGAQIELVDSSAELIIRGKIHLKPGAVFSFSGKGQVVYETPSYIPREERFVFEDSSRIEFTGAGPNDPVLIVRTNSWDVPVQTSPQDYFGGLIVRKGQIQLAQGVAMLHEAPLLFDSAHVTRTSYSGLHRGIRLAGQSNVQIANTKFTFGQVGLFNLQTAMGSALSLVNCEFSNNLIGLETQGERSSLVDCMFLDNNDFGWRATDQDGISMVANCGFTGNGTGVSFYGQVGSEIQVRDSQFNQNQTGIKGSETEMDLVCNTFSNQGMESIYVHLSKLIIGNHASNYFDSNALDIYLENARSLSLENGWNQFVHNAFPMDYYTIYGTFDPLFEGLNYHPQGWTLSASGNVFPTTGTGLIPCNMVIQNGPTLVPVSLMAGPIPAQMTLCRSSQIIGFDPNSLPQIPGGSAFNNKTLNQVVADAISLVARSEDGGDLDAALSELGNVLSESASSPLAAEFKAQTYKVMSKVYGLGIEWGDIDRNRAKDGEVLNEHLNDLNGYIASELQSLSTQDSLAADKAYAFKMDRAQLFRMSEHYDYAKTVLTNAHTWSSGDAFMRSQYWECVCEAEDDLLKEQIDLDEFKTQMTQCNLLMPASKRELNLPLAHYTPNHIEGLELRISPNPSKTQAYLKVISPSCLGSAVVRITDMNGFEVVPAQTMTMRSMFLLPKYIAPGLYVIQVEACGTTATEQWVVVD